MVEWTKHYRTACSIELLVDGRWLLVHSQTNYGLIAIDQKTKRPKDQNDTASAKFMSNSG